MTSRISSALQNCTIMLAKTMRAEVDGNARGETNPINENVLAVVQLLLHLHIFPLTLQKECNINLPRAFIFSSIKKKTGAGKINGRTVCAEIIYRCRHISFYTTEIKLKHRNLSTDASNKSAWKRQWSMKEKIFPSSRTNANMGYSHRVANESVNVTHTHSWDILGQMY